MKENRAGMLPHPSELRRRALWTWENEGGATRSMTHVPLVDVPDLTDAELMHLRVRVIALENLMIAVLAEGSDRQRRMALDMGDCISPRPGSSRHPLTIQAAHHMTDLIHRADRFRAPADVPES